MCVKAAKMSLSMSGGSMLMSISMLRVVREVGRDGCGELGTRVVGVFRERGALDRGTVKGMWGVACAVGRAVGSAFGGGGLGRGDGCAVWGGDVDCWLG